MSPEQLVVPGIVQGGVIVPQSETPLPDGAQVEIVLGADSATDALRAELAAWDHAGDEAWAMIDQWEQQDK